MLADPEVAAEIDLANTPHAVMRDRTGNEKIIFYDPNRPMGLQVNGQFLGTPANEQEFYSLAQAAQRAVDEGGGDTTVSFGADGTYNTFGSYARPWNLESDYGDVLKVAAPIALQFVPGLGTALGAKLGLSGIGAKAAGVGLTSALGRTGAGIVSGDPVLDSLKAGLTTGAISAATAGALGGIGGAKGSLISSGAELPAGTVLNAAGNVVDSVTGELIANSLGDVVTVLGSKLAPTLGNIASSAVGAGLGNIGSSLVNDTSIGRLADAYNQPTIAEVQPGLAFDQAMTEGAPIDVFGRPMGNSILGPAFSGAAGALAPAPAPAPVDAVVDPEQTVATQRPDPQGIATELAALGVPAAAVGAYLAAQGAGTGALTASETAAAGGIGGAAPVGAPITAGTAGVAGGSTVSQALAQAPRILGGVGAILGGIGGSGGGTPTAGGIGGGFNETVSFQPLNRTMRPVTFDPFTYGQSGGEFRFFGNEQPQFQTGIGAPAMVAPENPQTPRLARGGPVSGIGGGQDDLIDAKLSDGEYVISAQDVSDLGDGSNQEGARRLDEMRRLIRKGAGRKNTKTIAKPQKSVSSLLRAAR
jgi:hypothetical protein